MDRHGHEKQPHHNQINKDKNAEPREYNNIRPVCSFNYSSASKPIHYIQFPTIQVYPKQLSQLHLNQACNSLYEEKLRKPHVWSYNSIEIPKHLSLFIL
jgi:hypothetical protein